MTSKISKVANLAFQVFSQHSVKSTVSGPNVLSHSSLPKDKLTQLFILMNKIDGKDIGFDVNWTKSSTKKDGSNVSAPVMYVHITENESFSLGIFILRPGSRIPLHDHPDMFGLIKVIHGNIRCRSFSRVNENIPKSSFISRFKKWQMSYLVATKPHQNSILEACSETVLLTPTEGNFHELITVGDEGAAFVDILAPPYDHLYGKRECHFYQEVNIPQTIPPFNDVIQYNSQDDTVQSINGAMGDEKSHDYVYLTETHQPKDYWCDSAEYNGPSIV